MHSTARNKPPNRRGWACPARGHPEGCPYEKERGDAATKILVQVQAKPPRLSATPGREFQAIRLAG